jgi:hypothetical protein
MEELLEILKRVKDKWGQETVQAILRKMDSYPIQWRGTLRRSISYEQKDGPDGDIIFNVADYGKFIDEGTGLFGPKGTPIPRESIPKIAYYLKEWAQTKNLNPYAVATNIVKRGGVKPRPFFNSVIDARTEQLGELITSAYNEYLTNSINNISGE